MTAALLPPNATELEKALADIIGQALDVPVQIETLWNPWTCPEPFLPWLAWSLSVDYWNPDWTAQTKREVIANSYQVHASKGTVGALKRALGPLGMPITLREWWEHGGEPHTFGLTATALPVAPASEGVQRDLLRIVNATKPVRSHLTDLRMAAQLGQSLALAAAFHASEVAVGAGSISGRSTLESTTALACVVSPNPLREATGQTVGRQRLLSEARLATVLAAETGAENSGVAAGRNTLVSEALTALVADGASTTQGNGPAAGRRELAVAAPLAAAMSASHSLEVGMSTEEPEEILAQRIILSGAGLDDVTITAANGELMLMQNGKATFLKGRPAQPDIQQVGLVTGAAGMSAVSFSGAPGVLVVGDRIIINTVEHTLGSVAGDALNIYPPLEVDVDGVPALRIRDWEPEVIRGKRILLSGTSYPDMFVAAINGALLLIQSGKTTYLTGRPAQPDIQLVGMVTGLAGTSAVTFAGDAGVLVAGDALILDAVEYAVVSVAGATLNINPPLAADLDGIPALRLREGV